MKTLKGFVLGIVTSIAVAATMSQAGLFSSMVTSDWETKESKRYLVEAYGFDVRAYD